MKDIVVYTLVTCNASTIDHKFWKVCMLHCDRIQPSTQGVPGGEGNNLRNGSIV